MDNSNANQQTTLTTENILDFVYGLQRINDQVVLALTNQQLEAAENFITVGSKQFKIISTTTDISKAFLIQLDIAIHLNKMMTQNANRTMEILNQGQNELAELIKKNINALAETK